MCHLWCSSLADLIVGVQTAARAPLCSLLFRYLQTERNEGAIAREDKPRTKTTLVNRREHYSSEVPRPEASTPLPCRLLSCRPLHGHSYPWVSGGASYRAAPSTVILTRGHRGVAPPICRRFLLRAYSTPEAGQHPRPVNARGLTVSLLISLCPWWVPPSVDLGQRPRTGRYTNNKIKNPMCFLITI